jgi:hypothetical protein
MSSDNRQKAQIEKTSGGGHLGGTKFGQQNDAKTTGTNPEVKGNKARPNDGLHEDSKQRRD